MGFYYRKSANFGPFRATVSKSGVGWSVGGRGFRTGVTGSGRRYTTFSIPGTGIGYRTYGSRRGRGRAGCMGIIAVLLLVLGGGLALLVGRFLT